MRQWVLCVPFEDNVQQQNFELEVVQTKCTWPFTEWHTTLLWPWISCSFSGSLWLFQAGSPPRRTCKQSGHRPRQLHQPSEALRLPFKNIFSSSGNSRLLIADLCAEERLLWLRGPS